jgi:hypothetical protein
MRRHRPKSFARDAVLASLKPGVYMDSNQLAEAAGTTRWSISTVIRRLIVDGLVHALPGTLPILYGAGKAPQEISDTEGQPVRNIRPVGTWERKHAHLMGKATWFEGVAP